MSTIWSLPGSWRLPDPTPLEIRPIAIQAQPETGRKPWRHVHNGLLSDGAHLSNKRLRRQFIGKRAKQSEGGDDTLRLQSSQEPPSLPSGLTVRITLCVLFPSATDQFSRSRKFSPIHQNPGPRGTSPVLASVIVLRERPMQTGLHLACSSTYWQGLKALCFVSVYFRPNGLSRRKRK